MDHLTLQYDVHNVKALFVDEKLVSQLFRSLQPNTIPHEATTRAMVVSQGIAVRQLFHPSALNWELKNTWTRIEFRRVTYYAYIRGKVPFAFPDVKQDRRCHHRRLAITPSRHTGSCPLFTRAIRTDVPVTNLNTLPSVRLDTHRLRRPHMLLLTAVRARWRIWFGQRKSASFHRDASSSTRPPSQLRPIR